MKMMIKTHPNEAMYRICRNSDPPPEGMTPQTPFFKGGGGVQEKVPSEIVAPQIFPFEKISTQGYYFGKYGMLFQCRALSDFFNGDIFVASVSGRITKCDCDLDLEGPLSQLFFSLFFISMPE